MAKLSYADRKALPKSDFIFPEKRAYPIPDKSHARNALARASGKSVESKVRHDVHMKYPDLAKTVAAKQGKGKGGLHHHSDYHMHSGHGSY